MARSSRAMTPRIGPQDALRLGTIAAPRLDREAKPAGTSLAPRSWWPGRAGPRQVEARGGRPNHGGTRGRPGPDEGAAPIEAAGPAPGGTGPNPRGAPPSPGPLLSLPPSSLGDP